MAIFASAVVIASYAAVSPRLREQLWRYRKQSLLGIGLVAAIAVAYLPTLEARMFEGEGLQLSSRDELWFFYYREFLLSPIFGRGFGAGFIAGEDWLKAILTTPHNEYLHLIVIGGVVGLALCLGAIGLSCCQLWQASSPNDRQFLLALTPALALYALTDNILTYSSALSLYAYLGVVLTAPSLLMPAAPDSGVAPFQSPAAFSHQPWEGKAS
jgi:O-antigen ligase